MLSRKLKTRIIPLLLSVMLITLSGCGAEVEDFGENYGDLLDSPSGLVLTEDEHIYGWGRDDCLTCHNLNNIHLENRTDLNIDVEAIQDDTFEDGEAGCSACHGTNGL